LIRAEKFPKYSLLKKENDGNIKYVVVKIDCCIIELLEPDDKKALQLGKEGTIAPIAIEVRSLTEAVQELKGKNVEFATAIFGFDKLLNGVEGAFIKGPGGELVGLFEYKNEKPF